MFLKRTLPQNERSYQVWKRRFSSLSMELRVIFQAILHVITATAILHHIAIYISQNIPYVLSENDIGQFWIEKEEPGYYANEVKKQIIDNYFPNL